MLLDLQHSHDTNNMIQATYITYMTSEKEAALGIPQLGASSDVWWSLLLGCAVCDVTLRRQIHVSNQTFRRRFLTQPISLNTLVV